MRPYRFLLYVIEYFIELLRIPTFGILPFLRHKENTRFIQAARRVALEKGIEVREVEKLENRKFIIEPDLPKESITCYSLNHRSRKTATWSLLQRRYTAVAEYPGCHTLVMKTGVMTPELDDLIHQLTSDGFWQSRNIELDCTEEEVYIYWDDREGEEAARKIVDYLQLVSRTAP